MSLNLGANPKSVLYRVQSLVHYQVMFSESVIKWCILLSVGLFRYPFFSLN